MRFEKENNIYKQKIYACKICLKKREYPYALTLSGMIRRTC